MDYSLKDTDLDAIPRHYWYKCLFLEHPSLCFNVKPTKYDELRNEYSILDLFEHLFETLNLCTSADFRTSDRFLWTFLLLSTLKGRAMRSHAPNLSGWRCLNPTSLASCGSIRCQTRKQSLMPLIFGLWKNLQAPGVLVTGWWYNLHVSFLLAESENAGRWLGKMCSILYNTQ